MSELEVEDSWDQGGGEEHGGEHDQQQHEGEYGQENYEQEQQYENMNEDGGTNHYQGEDDGDDILDLDGDGGGEAAQQEGRLLMRFCPHDSSMLYPQEHKQTRTLRYACRLCRYSEESHNPMIYQNVLKKEVGNALQNIPSAVSDDPTLPRSQNAQCENCNHNEAVFFQSDTSDVRSDTLALIFVCCNCDHKWVG